MRVALDATYSIGPALTGVGVYSARLSEELIAGNPEIQFVLCYRPNRFFRALLSTHPPANTARRMLQEPLNLLLPARVSLFHGLNQRLPRYSFRRAVTTFHDLFVMSGEYSSADFRQRFTALARDAAARSDHIIAVSRHSAKRVECLLGVEPARVTVIYHGVDSAPLFAAEELRDFRRRWNLDRPFLLHVGAIQARKNIVRLVDAWERLEHEVDLVLAGSDGYGAGEVRARIAASPACSRVRMLGYVAADVLQRLYRSAEVLAFPSLDEGFGIPILEAMAAGVPVITSNVSALAEVAGDAAVLVDPEDTASIAAGLCGALTDTVLRRDLIAKGYARAKQFSWTRAAAETFEVYRRLA